MEIVNERLENGLLKGFAGQATPEMIEERLSRDVEIVAPVDRMTVDDLWPAVWALAAVLERQTHGKVLLRCGLDHALPAPSQLCARCKFTRQPAKVTLSLTIGCQDDSATAQRLIGDARANEIIVGAPFDAHVRPPTSIECFALAGYLGFAAIALLVGVPEYRASFSRPALRIPYDEQKLASWIANLEGTTSVGLGQVGQAFLALLFFLAKGSMRGRRLALVDDDYFEAQNGRTQVLLAHGSDWLGKRKTAFIADVVRGWGADVAAWPERITWAWRRTSAHPPIGLIGLHDLETRRMICGAGFEELLEAGVGTDLMRPRVSWHRLGCDSAFGKRVFQETEQAAVPIPRGPWVDALKSTPGGCGWLRFLDISATAPCLGIAAAAFSMAEVGGEPAPRKGAAILWSPILPLLRERIAA